MNNRILLPRPTIIGREHAFECFCSETCRTASAERVARDYSGGEIEEEYFRVIHRQQEELLNRPLNLHNVMLLLSMEQETVAFRVTVPPNNVFILFGGTVPSNNVLIRRDSPSE